MSNVMNNVNVRNQTHMHICRYSRGSNSVGGNRRDSGSIETYVHLKGT